MRLLAALVSCSFGGITGSDKGHAGVAAIQALTSFNMADHWTPATDGFLDRLHAELVAEAVVEARGKESAQQLAGLKKTERTATAAKLLAGSGWLPKLLRGPGYDATAVTTGQADTTKPKLKPHVTQKPATKKPATPAKPAKKPAVKKAAVAKKAPAKKKAKGGAK